MKNTTQTANNAKYSNKNYPGSVASYDARPGNEIGLFYTAHNSTRDKNESHKLYQKSMKPVKTTIQK